MLSEGRSSDRDTDAIQPGLAVEIRPARRLEPSGELAVAAIMQNEGRYLAEWLEFNRLIGVEHVFAYDNASTDNTWEILKQYEATGYVTAIPWDLPYLVPPQIKQLKVGAQKLAYGHAITTFGRGWRWMAFVDVDEFLFPTGGGDLRTVLADYRNLPGIGAFWSMFGTSGHEAAPEGLVLENYTMRVPFPVGTNFKSIVDPSQVTRVDSAHRFLPLTFDERHEPIVGFDIMHHRPTNSSEDGFDTKRYVPTNDVFKLHHYSTKSHSEIRSKLERYGRKGERFAARTAIILTAAVIEDRSAQRYVDPIRSALANKRQSTGASESDASAHSSTYESRTG